MLGAAVEMIKSNDYIECFNGLKIFECELIWQISPPTQLRVSGSFIAVILCRRSTDMLAATACCSLR